MFPNTTICLSIFNFYFTSREIIMSKKLFTFLLAVVASVGIMQAEILSGTCGTNLTWSLNTIDSTLTISGTGNMSDYTYSSPAPWYSYKYSITSVVINDGVTSIGNSAFIECSGLTSVTIPNSVTSIGDFAFIELGYLSVYISDIAAWCAINFGSASIMEHNLYLNGILVKDLVIPDGITSIGNGAFYGCTGLTSVTIPNSVTSIGESAFYGCSSLTTVTIPNSVTSIGWYAFYDVPNIVYTGTATGSPWGARSINGYVEEYLVYTDNAKTTLLACSSAAQGEIAIPNSVTSVGAYAFRNCRGLTSVTIPNSVTSVGYDAFFECSGLTSVNISDIEAWCNIQFSDFAANPLYYAHNLYINDELLKELIIPNSITTIGESAFYGCTCLTSVIIPNSVTNIGDRAFCDCRSLISVTIPNSVTSIGIAAFWGCRGLTSVTIPNSVTSIGDWAFLGCRGLEYIISSASTPPTISSSTFPSGVVVYVQNTSVDTYKSAAYWTNLDIKALCGAEIANAPTSVVLDWFHVIWDMDNNYISSCGILGGEQQTGNVLEYIGLEPNNEYKDVPIVLTSNTGEIDTVNISFTTTALELTTKASKPVSSTTAILLAETNMADAEVSCGFEYKRNDAPADMEGTKVFCPVASGQMAGRLKNLKDDIYYKYRAFYQSAAGNMYYGNWQYIFTGDNTVEFDPILYTYNATVVRENEATISGYALAGSEDFTEQGFEYWTDSRTNNGANAPHRISAAMGEHFYAQASGIKMTVTLTDLDAGTVYKYRAYGKVGNQYYYGSEQAFTTTGVYEEETPTAIDQVSSDQVQSTKAQKILRDGQIFIILGNKTFTITGQEVR